MTNYSFLQERVEVTFCIHPLRVLACSMTFTFSLASIPYTLDCAFPIYPIDVFLNLIPTSPLADYSIYPFPSTSPHRSLKFLKSVHAYIQHTRHGGPLVPMNAPLSLTLAPVYLPHFCRGFYNHCQIWGMGSFLPFVGSGIVQYGHTLSHPHTHAGFLAPDSWSLLPLVPHLASLPVC